MTDLFNLGVKMRWILLVPCVLFGQISSDLNMGLRALQQLRTLIPERLVNEEFAIIVDRNAFNEALRSVSHPMEQPGVPSIKTICCSNYYYSRVLLSGEPIRILDFYQEFEYGPYWRYPTSMHRLFDMHHANTPSPK